MLNEVKIIKKGINNDPKFIKVGKVTCKRDGRVEEYPWEYIEAHDSVHIFVNNTETKEAIFAKQVRVPLLINDQSQKGEVLELCAGLVDKDKPNIQIAIEEVEEELGYTPETIEHVRELKTGVGTSGNNSSIYYAEVTEANKISEGGGLESEDIEVVRIKYEDLESFAFSTAHTDSTTFGMIMWFLRKEGI